MFKVLNPHLTTSTNKESFSLEQLLIDDSNKNKLVIDYSQLAIISVTGVFKTEEEQENLTEAQVKTVILHNLRDVIKKFKNNYPDVIIAVDNTKEGSYKKEFALYYKAHRSEKRKDSKLNWNMIFSVMKTLEDDLRNVFGYKVISIPKLEADDVIGYVATEGNTGKYNTMIISSDSDFFQLHSKNTKQWSQMHQKLLQPKISPFGDLVVMLLKGSKKDSVSPLKCPGDFYYNQNMGNSDLNPFARAPSVKQAEIDLLTKSKNLDELREQIPTELHERLEENIKLQDLSIIPDEYKEKIKSQLEVKIKRDLSKIYSYLLQNNLQKLMDSVQDF